MITFKPLRRTLVERDMTIRDLEELCGTAPGVLNNIICGGSIRGSGRDDISISHVEKICDALKCSIDRVIRND